MTWLLRPGVGMARRDGDHVQLGVDRPRAAVLPDTGGVRRLLQELAYGTQLTSLDEVSAPALAELVRAKLVVPAEEEATRTARRGRCRVRLEVPDSVLPAALRLVGDAGLGLAEGRGDDAQDDETRVVLVWSVGELARDRVDTHARSSTPHLVVREGLDGPVVGPFVVPGVTACLRCVDAHAAEHDPRRALVVEQLATRTPLRPHAPEPWLRSLALAWAVSDLVTAAEGGVPATWSATADLTTLPPELRSYHRHQHCGCAWFDELGSVAG